jgi:hypothetical protein
MKSSLHSLTFEDGPVETFRQDIGAVHTPRAMAIAWAIEGRKAIEGDADGNDRLDAPMA